MENTETKDKAQTMSFGAEVSKVLKLMIHSLYTNKDIFLRELISNASDACDKLRYEALTAPSLLAEDAELRIKIAADKEARTLTITDNGIGMTRDELIANLGTIARSGTQEFMGQLTGDGKKDMPLIGQFGVGFYSAFMVADKVEVVSTRAGQQETFHWVSSGEGEFTISACAQAAEGDSASEVLRGTRITLHIRAGEDQYLDAFRLKHIVETYSDHIGFPISIDGEVANRGLAVWARPKSEITPEQHREFYRHVSHSPEEPWLIVHHKAEGKIEFTSLLYVPGIKPFDLFHPDRKRRVKLYIRRVFITDEGVDLIPAYLRFLRGVVDSEDLPLNISRETLQANPTVTKIREAVIKKILSELKKKAEAAPEEYAAFWANFGPVLKEGLCEAAAPREQLLEVCRFATTASSLALPLQGGGLGGGPETLTGLDDYIARMKPGQEQIFYLTGDDAEALRRSPQIEGFLKRGIEVLLLTDHVDDFWLSVMPEYKGKAFRSVTRADIDLDAFGKVEGEKKEETPPPAGMDALIARFKSVLSSAVADVRTTGKLSGSATCLAVEEGAMDMRLERFLIEQKQLQNSAPKILELNPAHPVIRRLSAMVEENVAESRVADVIWLLFDQARVSEGEPVTDPAAFARRINSFVESGLVA